MRLSRWVLPLILPVMALVLCSCGGALYNATGSTTVRGAPPTVSPGADQATCALPADWNNQASVLIQGKAEQAGPTGGQAAMDAGAWAYQSLPVTLASTGTYTFLFPVPSSFDYPISPQGVAVNLPPLPGVIARPSATVRPSVVSVSGTRYYEESFDFLAISTACQGVQITAWGY